MTFDQFQQGVEAAAKDAPNLGKTLKMDLGEGIIYIDLSEDEAKVSNEDKEADTVVITTVDVLDQLRKGELNPMMAMMGGKIKIKGDMGLAMQLKDLLG